MIVSDFAIGEHQMVPWASTFWLKSRMRACKFSSDFGLPSPMRFLHIWALNWSECVRRTWTFCFADLLSSLRLPLERSEKMFLRLVLQTNSFSGWKPPQKHPSCHSKNILAYRGFLHWRCLRHWFDRSKHQRISFCCHEVENRSSGQSLRCCYNACEFFSCWFLLTISIVLQVGIKALNHVINSAILIFVMSAANSDLYIGSRTLYGLAIEGKAPAIFKRVNRTGVPYPALILCTAFCGLVFLNVGSSSARGK